MGKYQRDSRAGFGRVDFALLLIVAFLAACMSYAVDRALYHGKNLQKLIEWSDVKFAEMQRGYTDQQVTEFLTMNLQNTESKEFVLIAGVMFAVVMAIFLFIRAHKRVKKWQHHTALKKQTGNKAAGHRRQAHKTKSRTARRLLA